MAQKDVTPGTQPTGTPDDGNWVNPAIRAENQRYLAEQNLLQAQRIPEPVSVTTYPVSHSGASFPAAHPVHQVPNGVGTRPPRRPVLGVFRRFLCVLLAVFTLGSGLAGAFAYWAQTVIVDTANFSALTESIATDEEFKTNLSAGVTEDIMGSSAVSTYLGDGNSTAWYGGVQNWLYDQTESLVASATAATVNSEAYPGLIQQVIVDTHAYNFSGEARPAVLDLSALYEEAEASVNGVVPLNIDTASLPGRTIVLDPVSGVYPINGAIRSLMMWAGAWQLLLTLCGVSALLGFLLWPGHRFVYLAVLGYLGAGLLWVVSLIGGGLSLTSGLSLPASSTAVVFVQKLSELVTASYADFHAQIAGNTLIAAVVFTVLAMLVGVLRLTARATTARTR